MISQKKEKTTWKKLAYELQRLMVHYLLFESLYKKLRESRSLDYIYEVLILNEMRI